MGTIGVCSDSSCALWLRASIQGESRKIWCPHDHDLEILSLTQSVFICITVLFLFIYERGSYCDSIRFGLLPDMINSSPTPGCPQASSHDQARLCGGTVGGSSKVFVPRPSDLGSRLASFFILKAKLPMTIRCAWYWITRKLCSTGVCMRGIPFESARENYL